MINPLQYFKEDDRVFLMDSRVGPAYSVTIGFEFKQPWPYGSIKECGLQICEFICDDKQGGKFIRIYQFSSRAVRRG